MLIENPVDSCTKGLKVNVTTQNFIRTYRKLGRVSDEVIPPEVTKGRVVLGKCVYEYVTLVLTLVAGSDVARRTLRKIKIWKEP